MALKDRLRQARKKAKMTQTELAERVHSTQQVIGNIETGVSKQPRRSLLMALAKELDVSPAWLLFGDERIDKLSKDAINVALLWDSLPDEQKEAFKTLLDLNHRNIGPK